jgi:8-oxo-dGTP pyrophosphatase MutT (NUDIX family)
MSASLFGYKMKTRHRAYAYVTYKNKVLLFTHPLSPEAGIQVPAGTIQEGEKPEDAALREAEEETGLQNLRMVAFLDQDIRDMSDCGTAELQYRWFYHIECLSEPPEKWMHGEHGKNGEIIIPFDFYWSEINALPKLIANYDDKIPQLIESLKRKPN